MILFLLSTTDYNGYLDFGEPREFEHVSFIRRGDGNDIFPGDEYELYYWNGHQMVLFDTYVPNDVYINVCGIPAGRLYYIRCTTRGVQQRIFEYDSENNSIIWH